MTAFASPEQLRHIVQAAGLAPSVHNTQPWRFVVREDGLELHADQARQLAVLDPDGRQLHLSCGAALVHARLAARGLGQNVAVHLLPDVGTPSHLANLVVSRGAPPTDDELGLASAMLLRHTYRGAFEARAIPAAVLELLRLSAQEEGATLQHVSDPDALIELEVLLSRADAAEQNDPRYRDELATWVNGDAAAGDGIPASALASAPGSSLRQRDFLLTAPEHADGSAPPADHPTVLLLSTDADDPTAWLRAGQALAAVLLRAATHGVQAQPLGQVTDAVAHRLGLRGALGMLGYPQLVLRTGYTTLASATPRRDVQDLLVAMGT